MTDSQPESLALCHLSVLCLYHCTALLLGFDCFTIASTTGFVSHLRLNSQIAKQNAMKLKYSAILNTKCYVVCCVLPGDAVQASPVVANHVTVTIPAASVPTTTASAATLLTSPLLYQPPSPVSFIKLLHSHILRSLFTAGCQPYLTTCNWGGFEATEYRPLVFVEEGNQPGDLAISGGHGNAQEE